MTRSRSHTTALIALLTAAAPPLARADLFGLEDVPNFGGLTETQFTPIDPPPAAHIDLPGVDAAGFEAAAAESDEALAELRQEWSNFYLLGFDKHWSGNRMRIPRARLGEANQSLGKIRRAAARSARAARALATAVGGVAVARPEDYPATLAAYAGAVERITRHRNLIREMRSAGYYVNSPTGLSSRTLQVLPEGLASVPYPEVPEVAVAVTAGHVSRWTPVEHIQEALKGGTYTPQAEVVDAYQKVVWSVRDSGDVSRLEAEATENSRRFWEGVEALSEGLDHSRSGDTLTYHKAEDHAAAIRRIPEMLDAWNRLTGAAAASRAYRVVLGTAFSQAAIGTSLNRLEAFATEANAWIRGHAWLAEMDLGVYVANQYGIPSDLADRHTTYRPSRTENLRELSRAQYDPKPPMVRVLLRKDGTVAGGELETLFTVPAQALLVQIQ